MAAPGDRRRFHHSAQRGQRRRQRSVRILRHVTAALAYFRKIRRGEFLQIVPEKRHRSRLRRHEADQRAQQRGFAAARFADDGQRPPLFHGEGKPRDRPMFAAVLGTKAHEKILHPNRRFHSHLPFASKYRAHEPARVGMTGRRQQIFRCAALDQSAVFHHEKP